MLRKKMMRDILGNKGSYFSCLVLIIIGLLVYMSFSIASDNLQLAKSTLYEEKNFAEGFAEVVSMPKKDVAGLTDVEGVEKVSGRVITEVRVNDAEKDESVYLRLVSQNLADPARLNNMQVIEGEGLIEGEPYALLDASFMEAHQLEKDESLELIHEGELKEIIVQGIGLSPEFVYLIRDEAELYPNPEQFGVAFLPLETMWDMFPEISYGVNNLAFTLSPDADYDRVEERLEQELEPYGLTNIYPREDQTSHFILQEEIEVIELLSTFFPVIILAVAGFIIFILLKRLVEQQRTHIGIMKALGYTNREVLLHYLSFSLVLALSGGVLGAALGMWMANPLTSLLYDFFILPETYAGFSLSYLALGIILSLVIMGFAGYMGCRQVLKLEPAEAMQPPAPSSGRKNILEKITFFTSMLTVQGKMALRNLGRSRSRSAFMFFGIMISCALVAFTWSLAYETMPTFMFHQYDYVETYDARVNLSEPQPRSAAQQELEKMPDIERVEPMIELPVSIHHHWNEEEIILMGLTRQSTLYNILDVDNRRVPPSKDGLILSERLAQNLDLSPGDSVEVDSPYFPEKVQLLVLEKVPQYIGMNAFLEISALEELTRQEPFATTLLVDGAESGRATAAALNERYRESEKIAGVEGWLSLRETLEEEWEAAGSIVYMFVFIGIIFSFSIIYISSFIILSERNRELASMRVLGMTSREVLSVITFEQWFLSFFAIIAGMPLAAIIQEQFAREWSTDMYAMPTEISTLSLLVGVVFTVLSIWVAQRFALNKVKKLDLVEVLKSRE